MVKVKFFKKKEAFLGFTVAGHADYDDKGRDIVCASVTSAVQMTINGICEILRVNADVKLKNRKEQNEISMQMADCGDKSVQAFMRALYLHLDLLSQDYIGTIQLTDVEV